MTRGSHMVVENKALIQRETNTVVRHFLRLFQTYPVIQDRFELFKGKSLDELRTSPKMKAHATSVFYALTSYVENVDDPETLVGLVQKIAVSHVGRGIPSDDFEVSGCF